jgi:hypothetical protein
VRIDQKENERENFRRRGAGTPTDSAYDTMSVKELRGIASNAGIGHAAIEDARDAHDPQAALIALITEAQSQP